MVVIITAIASVVFVVREEKDRALVSFTIFLVLILLKYILH